MILSVSQSDAYPCDPFTFICQRLEEKVGSVLQIYVFRATYERAHASASACFVVFIHTHVRTEYDYLQFFDCN